MRRARVGAGAPTRALVARAIDYANDTRPGGVGERIDRAGAREQVLPLNGRAGPENVAGRRAHDRRHVELCAMRMAADLWAQARNIGQPTAPDPAIDADVILAAQAISLNTPVVVATGNPGHLNRFVPAELWANITP